MQVRVLPGSCSEWHTWLSRKKVAAESSNVKVCSIPPGRSTLQVTSLHNDSKQGPVAQWIRHRPTEPGIAGSSPAGVIGCFVPLQQATPAQPQAKSCAPALLLMWDISRQGRCLLGQIAGRTLPKGLWISTTRQDTPRHPKKKLGGKPRSMEKCVLRG